MPIVKSNESLGHRPVIAVLYGDPGICKTSLANTCENPLLLDFDRGVQRSYGRKDTLVLDSWEEVVKEEQAGSFRGYKTIIIDTAKAALDDFLMVYVCNQDYKLKTNKLKAYGAIGDAFKLFVNNRRSEGVDIVIIAHAKKDEDTKRHIPDVTGQSYQLLMRIADQVGYITMENNQRVISFNPTDLTVGKNVAGLDKMHIPAKETEAWKGFGAGIITSVKEALSSMDEAQREALEKSAKFQDELAKIETPDELNDFLAVVNEQPDYLKLPLRKAVGEKAKAAGWVPNKETKRFELPAAEPAAPVTTPAQAPTTPAQAAAEPEKPKAAPKKQAPAKPEAAPAPAAAVAQKQELKWFEDRKGKDVWMQHPDPTQFAGPYGIDGDEFPAFMFNDLQAQGFVFRDLTPADMQTAGEGAAHA